MALPTDRASFVAYCLRNLGDQVSTINVSPDQCDDRVDEALTFFYEWHDEATEKQYYSHQVTSTDITNRYLTMPTNIISVNYIFPIGLGLSSNNMFNIRYQLLLNDLANISAMQLGPYVQIFQNLQLIEEILIGQTPIIFTKHTNRVNILANWQNVNVGDYLVLECYGKIDPVANPSMWANRWLLTYATTLIKRQWGTNLTKFTGMNLVGGSQFNGDRILNDAQREILKLEEDCKSMYSVQQAVYLG